MAPKAKLSGKKLAIPSNKVKLSKTWVCMAYLVAFVLTHLLFPYLLFFWNLSSHPAHPPMLFHPLETSHYAYVL